MAQATSTTKLPLDLSPRRVGGAGSEKRASLEATGEIHHQARAFYVAFFPAHLATGDATC